MELRRLKYFLVIAAEGSLGKASRVLGIAQPALSRQMQLLEADLGIRLFERVATGMRVTDEGCYLRDTTVHAVDQITSSLHNVRTFGTRVEASCTLGLPPALSAFAAGLVGKFREQMPNLKLRVVEDNSAKLGAALLRGTIDVAILTGATPDDSLFKAEILSEQLLLVGSPTSDLARVGEVRFEELEHYPLIVPSRPDSLASMLEKLAARMSSRIVFSHEVDSLAVTKELVKAGEGYALLSPVAFADDARAGTLVGAKVVDPDLEQSTHFAVREHWRVPRSVYVAFHRIIYDEWMAVVDRGAWPAKWLFDRDVLLRRIA